MKKFALIFIICTVSIFQILSLDKFEYSKTYTPNVFCGGREKVTIDDNSLHEYLKLNDVYTKVDLYRNNARVRSYYYFQNKSKSECVDFTFSYPKIDITLTTEIQKLADNFDVQSVSHVDRIIEGNYENYKISIDGVDEPFVNERGVVVETNIPFKYGDEAFYVDETGVAVSEETDSYVYLYGWYHSNLSIEPNSKAVVCVSYTVPLYQNVVKIFGRADLNFEDPALNYDFCDKQYIHNDYSDCRVLFGENVFSFYNYVPYESQISSRRRKLEIFSHLIDDNFIKISSLKTKKSQKVFAISFDDSDLTERDNIYVKVSEYNSELTVPSYYFDFIPMPQRDKASICILDKDNKEVTLKYNPKNKRVSSSLLPKKNDISVTEIRMVASGLVKSKNTTFEVFLSDNPSFENCIKNRVQVSLPEYNELVAKNGYFVLFSGVATNVKYIKIKVIGNSATEDEFKPILIDAIEVLQ